MRANLPQTEPVVLAKWEKEGLYRTILCAREKAPVYILHDGPPYANGDIHMGHALNKTLKDFVVRYQILRGKRVPYIPGWDCHGLPIEYALMKELKVSKDQVDVTDFRRKARQYAKKYVGIQRDQFKRLGVLGDWENPYLTLEPGYVTAALRVLAELTQKGFVYRARRPVNWCWSCETALAEAEVEYERHSSPSIYVKFKLDEAACAGLAGQFPALKGKDLFLVIWTTTPWTLMGNVAVAVHPSFSYAVWGRGRKEGWIVLSTPPPGARVLVGESRQLVDGIRGSSLEGLAYLHPFGLRHGKVVLADYVSAEDGTGLVHTAPGFGAEDYATGRKYDLEVLAPVDAQGKFAGLPKEVSEFNGRQVQQANPAVIEKLKASGHLLGVATLEHDYPHCWRCHNPIIFRATDQWFLKIDHENLRQKIREIIWHQVHWIPPEGKDRIGSMVGLRPDWCLSRQRLWGIPIPAVICSGCGEGILEPAVIQRFADAIEKDPEGSDKWFTEPVTAWLPPDFRCRCGSTSFTRGTDILDVWFDSGVSHRGVLQRRKELSYPADLYLEGSDQHRGWFQVSLITAAALDGAAPYRSVLTHGFVVDGQGRKMSKSLGNVIAPQEVIASTGADVLRLWVASSDYKEDIRLSKEILGQVADLYRKIRNTIRFCLANVSDFEPAGPPDFSRLEKIDRWALSRLHALAEEVTAAYDQYAFHRVVKAIHEFCAVEMSNFYLDVVKDRLYTFHPKNPQRLSAQTAIRTIADVLIRLAAPLVPVTASEAWEALHRAGAPPVQMSNWPAADTLPPRDAELEKTWEELLRLRDEIMKSLEKARQQEIIGDSLEAEVEITVRDEKQWEFLKAHEQEAAAACIVSGLRLVKGSAPGGEPISIHVRRAAGEKCQRCWMRLPTVGRSAQHPALCHRCVENIAKPSFSAGKL
ncbi:MAG: isoleucine--tRNA ligase [Candidatus Omnitrophica bacterium]|nr:isoleucine--tRNA ligase [Candidatus Omnitrophota bacterium]